jgi:predicted MFS family arabinose efflux permease
VICFFHYTQKWYADFLDLLKDMADFSMFLEWHFLLMSVATILLFTWFIIPYFYLAELMVRNGYTEQEASALLSIIGFTNFIGMVRLCMTIFEKSYQE